MSSLKNVIKRILLFFQIGFLTFFKCKRLLGDTSKFINVAFNSKHKVNKEVRHLADNEFNIRHCLDDLLENNYLSQEDYNFMRPCGNQLGVSYGLCKVHKNLINLMDQPHFAQSVQSSVLAHTTQANFSQAKRFVLILKEFTVNEYTVKDSFSFSNETRNKETNLLRLTSNLSSSIYHWMRQFKFVWNCYFIKRKKLNKY